MPRWLRFSFGLLAVALLLTSIILLWVGVRPSDVARLVVDGSVKELRDELRPPRPDEPRVLLFAIDGVGDAELRRAIREGRVPRIASLVGNGDPESDVWPNAFAPRGALSILPSTTYAAWTAVFTGEPVGRSGVSGNEWFDRASRTFVAPAPVSVSGYGDAVRVYSESLMDAWLPVETVFERADVRSYASLVAQHRGADLLIQPDARLLGEAVAMVAAGVGPDSEVDPDKYVALDRQSVRRTIDAIEEHGLADLTAVYLPGIDLYSHTAHDALAEQVHYLGEVVDPLVGELLDAYDERGALDDTYVLFVSDHGHTPALDTDRNALGTGEGQEWSSVLEQAGFRIRPFEAETDHEEYQAVFAYQGAFAYVYLADRSLCPDEDTPCDWTRAPRFEEDVLEAVRAIDSPIVDGVEAPELRETLDLIFTREPRGVDTATAFQVWAGQSLMPVGEYLADNPRPDLLDLEERLEALGAGPLGHRAGDILLLSRYRMEDPIEERFYFSTLYRSWHGSPSAQDSEIMWVLARRGESGERLREIAFEAVGETPGQLDITPLVLHLLGRR
jgi:hypothetical protein